MITITEADLGCAWCEGRPCLGDGYLNPQGAGTPCGADHASDGATISADYRSHTCAACHRYCCGIHTLHRGFCPDCGDPTEAAEVLASGQQQPCPDEED